MTLGIAHITGSIKVESNSFFETYGDLRKSRTVGQMLFQPYESSQEFIFCARQTAFGALGFTLLLLEPIPMLIAYGAVFSIGLIMTALAGNIGLNLCDTVYGHLQLTVTTPIAVLLMCTRGFSTLLQATGVYDYDAASCSPTP